MLYGFCGSIDDSEENIETMKRVMVVGASAWQAPMIKKAKELGYHVGVIDYNPEAEGVSLADEYFNASTIDPEGVYRATEAFRADGITTVATDMPMRAIAYTCEKLGLTGIDSATAVRATDKVKMIKAFDANRVAHPWYYVVKNGNFRHVRNELTFPCISKPTDNAASRGVVILNSLEELEDGIRYSASNGRSGDVIIEQLLIGKEISVETFAVSGKVHIIAITDKITTGAPYFVEMGHNQPSVFSGQVKHQIVRVAEEAMRAVGIQNGPAHVEMMVTDEGPVMIELGARLGGDFITTDLVPLSTGVDMLAATIHWACGDPVDIFPKFTMASAIRYMKTKEGIIREVRNLKEANAIEGVGRVVMLKPTGSQATEIKNSLDRIGYAIAQGRTVEEAGGLCDRALDMVNVVIGGETGV